MNVKSMTEKIIFDDNGQVLVEYSLIIIIVAVSLVLMVSFLGESVVNLYEFIVEKLP